MKDLNMDIKWRTVQFFLGEEGVSEVEVDSENTSKTRCSCRSFQMTARCKHVKFVKGRMEDSEGHYNIVIPEDVPDSAAVLAVQTPEAFRTFIMKYGKVEVID
jgi:hypothetical protein